MMIKNALLVIALPAFSIFTFADEASFRDIERQSLTLQLQDLQKSQNGCTLENAGVRREWCALNQHLSLYQRSQLPGAVYPLMKEGLTSLL